MTGNDPNAPERTVPTWADCGCCENCAYGKNLYDPFQHVSDLLTIFKTYHGLCVVEDEEPMVVPLYGDMPCGGEQWVLVPGMEPEDEEC